MSRLLYVHVGPRKTATTTIQNLLSKHDNSVVVYPKFGLHPEGSHHNLVFKFFGEGHRCSGRKAEANVDSLFRDIADEVQASSRNVLISSEELASRDVMSFVREIMSYFNDGSFTVEFLVACREHFARAASWYKMRLRVAENGEQFYLPDQFLDAKADKVCYERLIRKLKNTGCRVTALNYEPSGDWPRRFLKYIGFGENELPEILPRMQIGPGRKALVATIATNQVVGSRRERLRYLRAFGKMEERRGEALDFIFGGEAAARAEQYFRKDRQFLGETCDIKIEGPKLEAQQNTLFINGAELEEIAEIAREGGIHGNLILAVARRFVRE